MVSNRGKTWKFQGLDFFHYKYLCTVLIMNQGGDNKWLSRVLVLAKNKQARE
jgi:hypothetical protein